METTQPKWEPLGENLRVLVSSHHRFGTDTVLLSDFSRPKRGEKKAVELCAGCGALSLMWYRERTEPFIVDAVEIQADACELMETSVKENGLDGRYRVIHADLKQLKGSLPLGSYDLVVCNPPYKAIGTGVTNPLACDLLARHEAECTIEEVARAAAGLLRFSGRLCLCQRPERLTDILTALRKAGLEPKRLRLVQQRPTKPPKLFLLEARRGGKPGGLLVEPVLMIEDGAKGYSEEMRRIYGGYARKEGVT